MVLLGALSPASAALADDLLQLAENTDWQQLDTAWENLDTARLIEQGRLFFPNVTGLLSNLGLSVPQFSLTDTLSVAVNPTLLFLGGFLTIAGLTAAIITLAIVLGVIAAEGIKKEYYEDLGT